MVYGLSNGHVTDDVTSRWRVKLVTPIRLERNISKTILEPEASNMAFSFVWGMPTGRTNNFSWKWAWPRSRDPYNFWHTMEHISKTTWANIETSNLVRGFVWECWAGAQIIFPESERLLWGSRRTVGYPSDSLASCNWLTWLWTAESGAATVRRDVTWPVISSWSRLIAVSFTPNTVLRGLCDVVYTWRGQCLDDRALNCDWFFTDKHLMQNYALSPKYGIIQFYLQPDISEQSADQPITVMR